MESKDKLIFIKNFFESHAEVFLHNTCYPQTFAVLSYRLSISFQLQHVVTGMVMTIANLTFLNFSCRYLRMDVSSFISDFGPTSLQSHSLSLSVHHALCMYVPRAKLNQRNMTIPFLLLVKPKRSFLFLEFHVFPMTM